MKRVLLDFRGIINEVVDPGQEFDVYDGPDATIKWVTCPHADVTSMWHCCNGEWISPEQKLNDDHDLQRRVAYGDLGDQLDMLYKDIKAGNLENGSWVQRIDQVKASITRQSDWETTSEYAELKRIHFHSEADPAWNHLPESALTPPNIT